ncbi:MAG: serine hydrolase [Phycisphaera sp.]|nr:serine hydrolase [Phycisphaera sp.]
MLHRTPTLIALLLAIAMPAFAADDAKPTDLPNDPAAPADVEQAIRAAPPAPTPEALKAKIDALAKPLIDGDIVVGMVVGVYLDGKTHVYSYGETKRGSGNAPDENTVYEIGSCTKVFTAVLLADLAEREMIGLRDRVQNYLPDEVKLPSYQGKEILVEHLSTHSSGLPRIPDNFKPADPHNPYADYTVEQMYAYLNGATLNTVPGIDYAYSNLGVGLLGHVLSRVADKPYEQLLVERVCDPIGMPDTRVTLGDTMKQRLAPPYDAELEPEHTWDFDALVGCGGVRSTAKDLLAFLRANVDKNDTPIGKAIIKTHEIRLGTRLGISAALGWVVARDGITRLHSGQTGGYHSFMAVVPLRDLGVVVLANTATDKVSSFGEQVVRAAFGIDEQPITVRKPVDVKPDVLKRYPGTYLLVPGFAITVTLEDGKLMAQATGQDKFRLFAESDTSFFYKVVDASITFSLDKDGTADKLTLHQAGRDIPAHRVNE